MHKHALVVWQMEKAQDVISSNLREMDDLKEYISLLEERNINIQHEAADLQLDTSQVSHPCSVHSANDGPSLSRGQHCLQLRSEQNINY